MVWDGMGQEGIKMDGMGQDNSPSKGYLSFDKVDNQKCVFSPPECDSHGLCPEKSSNILYSACLFSHTMCFNYGGIPYDRSLSQCIFPLMEKDKCSAEGHPYNVENLKKLCALENHFKLESNKNNKYY